VVAELIKLSILIALLKEFYALWIVGMIVEFKIIDESKFFNAFDILGTSPAKTLHIIFFS
jgi:hypothetical protein